MTEVITGVEEPVAPTVEAQPEVENSTVVSDDGAKVDRRVYEKVREDMLAYKAEKKAKEAKIADLEARILAVEAAKVEVDDEPEDGDVRTKAKVDILYLVQTDPFVKENLDLIEEKMSENPKMTAQAAIKEIKSDFFDRMQKEVSRTEPEVPPKQINPKGNSTLKEAIESDTADPRQVEAYKAQLARLG